MLDTELNNKMFRKKLFSLYLKSALFICGCMHTYNAIICSYQNNYIFGESEISVI